MSVKVREQRGKLYLDIYQHGVRKWESLHITLGDDKKRNKELYRLAEACRSKREAQILAGEWNISLAYAGSIPLSSYIKSYSKKSNIKEMSALVMHVERFSNGATIPIGHVTSKWIEDFQKNLTLLRKPNGMPLSMASVGFYMKLLRIVFNKAVKDAIINKNPMSAVCPVKIPAPDMVFLNEDELRQLASAAPDSDFGKEVRRAFLFACFTGLRVSDLETLTWGMIEKNPVQIIKRQKKTQKPVYIPLNNSAQSLIFDEGNHTPDEFVFTLHEASRSKCENTLKKWAEEAGITKKIGWHTARRTFATLVLGRGADAITVARLLGHSGLSQVMKYAKSTDEMKRRAVDALPKLFSE